MRRARHALTVALGVLAAALLVRTALAGRRELGDLADHPHWADLAAMTACAAFAMVWIAARWDGVLAMLGAPIGRARGVAVYFVGEIGKYLPGGIWPVLGRGELATRQPVQPAVMRAVSYASVLMSLAYLFLAGLLCGGAAAVWALSDSRGSAAPLLLLLLLPVGLGCLHPAVSGRAFALAGRVLRRDTAAALRLPSWGVSMAMVASYVPAWAGVVGASWFAARALGAHPGLGLLAVAACLGWVAGFLVLPAPGGIGAREAVFAAVLGTSVEPGRAAAVATLARLAFVAVDAGGAALGAAWLASAARRGPTPPDA